MMEEFDRADITICSSSRFYAEVAKTASALEAKGLSVYTPRLDFDETKEFIDAQKKNELTHEFLRKVAASDSIYIVNPGGYIGMSVAIESGFAYALGKRIVAMDKPSEPAVAALISQIATVDELPQID